MCYTFKIYLLSPGRKSLCYDRIPQRRCIPHSEARGFPNKIHTLAVTLTCPLFKNKPKDVTIQHRAKERNSSTCRRVEGTGAVMRSPEFGRPHRGDFGSCHLTFVNPRVCVCYSPTEQTKRATTNREHPTSRSESPLGLKALYPRGVG